MLLSFLVEIKLGELMATHDFVLKVTYWPQGKDALESSDNSSDNCFPLLLNYSYKD